MGYVSANDRSNFGGCSRQRIAGLLKCSSPGKNLTAREAADKFAAEIMNGRKVGEWNGNTFNLVDGRNWYWIAACRGGWEITVEEGK